MQCSATSSRAAAAAAARGSSRAIGSSVRPFTRRPIRRSAAGATVVRASVTAAEHVRYVSWDPLAEAPVSAGLPHTACLLQACAEAGCWQ